MVTKIRHSLRVLILSMFLASAFSVMFTVWSANTIASRSGDKAVCQMLDVNLSAYREDPPKTELGKNLQVRYAELYKSQCG